MDEWQKQQMAITVADAMIENDWRLRDIAQNLLLPLTRVWGLIALELPYIDDYRYVQCKNMMRDHRHNRIPRGRRY